MLIEYAGVMPAAPLLCESAGTGEPDRPDGDVVAILEAASSPCRLIMRMVSDAEIVTCQNPSFEHFGWYLSAHLQSEAPPVA